MGKLCPYWNTENMNTLEEPESAEVADTRSLEATEVKNLGNMECWRICTVETKGVKTGYDCNWNVISPEESLEDSDDSEWEPVAAGKATAVRSKKPKEDIDAVLKEYKEQYPNVAEIQHVPKVPKSFTRVPRRSWKRADGELKSEIIGCSYKCTGNCDKVEICPVETAKEPEMEMAFVFQVAGVNKPLISVKRVTEMGNVVCFGPNKEDNFIFHKAPGNKVLLRKIGKGSYMLDVSFVDGTKTEITVASGAEESVCPLEWGKQFKVASPKKWMTFRAAGGENIEHYGEREVRQGLA